MEIKIQGVLATLNDHDSANRANRFVGAKLKSEMTELVRLQLLRTPKAITPCLISFHWRHSGRHDYDNIRFAAKYVLDGMVKAGVLEDDSPKFVIGFGGDTFEKVEKGQEGVDVKIDQPS